MTTRLRDAAGLFIEAGRAMGHAEAIRSVVELLRPIAQIAASDEKDGQAIYSELMTAIQELRRTLVRDAGACDALTKGVRAHADAMMHELEHPGATLARRLLRTARAVRHAWRSAR